MKATFHAISFFLVCVVAYYIALVVHKNEELSVEKHTVGSHSSHEDDGLTPAPVEEPEEPAESLQDAANFPDHGAEEPTESHQDVINAPDHGADEPEEVPNAQEVETQQPDPLARGWGEDIDWVETYEEGLGMAKTSQKPLMVIHHLESCPICKDLKAAFSGHEEIQRMAKEDFIMFNLMHETKDSNMAPDGYYVPRIIFVDPAMVVRNEITANGVQYRYSYTDKDVELLLENMKKAKMPAL